MPHSETAAGESGLFGRMLDWLKARTRPGDNLAAFSQDDLRQMADDLSISREDLVAMAPDAPDNTALMHGMMLARGLEPEAVRNCFTMLLRDMQRVCTRCRSTRRCLHELADGTAAAHSHEFCPNAGTFDDLIDFNMGR